MDNDLPLELGKQKKNEMDDFSRTNGRTINILSKNLTF
jgi:hypothetical protein